MAIVTICTVALSLLSHKPQTEQMAVCINVMAAAQERGFPLPIVASLSWHESRFRYVTSKAGAVGPLQVLPKYWCKEKDCDYINSGLDALEWYMKRSRNYTHAICRYNAGKCYKISREWARKVMKTARILAAKAQSS